MYWKVYLLTSWCMSPYHPALLQDRDLIQSNCIAEQAKLVSVISFKIEALKVQTLLLNCSSSKCDRFASDATVIASDSDIMATSQDL